MFSIAAKTIVDDLHFELVDFSLGHAIFRVNALVVAIK